MLTLMLMAAAVPVPANSFANWVTAADYPKKALAKQAEGTTGFRLTIGNDGVPTECVIISTSGNAALDTATCDALFVRARFEPAGAEGYTRSNSYSNSVAWLVPQAIASPDDGPVPMELALQGIVGTAEISADGKISKCADSIIGQPVDDPFVCSVLETPNFMDSQLPQPTGSYDKVTMRLIIGPAYADLSLSGYSSADDHIVLTTASFGVPASGTPQNCAASKWQFNGRELDICTAFIDYKQGFAPDPQRTTPVSMQVFFDIWARKRQ